MDVKPVWAILDLVLPMFSLVFVTLLGMVATGGFFEGETLVEAFRESDMVYFFSNKAQKSGITIKG